MTPDKDAIPAGELAKRLEHDPQFQERQRRRDHAVAAKQEQHAQILRPFVKTLNSLGLSGDTLEAIVRQNAPLPLEATNVLLSALHSVSDERLAEALVRALGASSSQFDGRQLAERFDSTQDDSLKWAIVNTVIIVRPYAINDWLERISGDRYWGKLLRQLAAGQHDND